MKNGNNIGASFVEKVDVDTVSMNNFGDIIILKAFDATKDSLKDKDWKSMKWDSFLNLIDKVVSDFQRDGYLIHKNYPVHMKDAVVLESSDENGNYVKSHVAFEAEVKCRKEANVPTKH